MYSIFKFHIAKKLWCCYQQICNRSVKEQYYNVFVTAFMTVKSVLVHRFNLNLLYKYTKRATECAGN